MVDWKEELRRSTYILPKFTFRCLGLSVNENESTVYKAYSYLMIITGFLFSCTSLHLVVQNLNNYDIIISGMFNVVGGFAAFLKIVVIKYNSKRLKKIFDNLRQIQYRRNKEKWVEEETYRKNKLMMALLVGFYTTLFAFYAVTLLRRIFIADSSKWILPISDFSLFNTSYSPNFEIAWLYHCIGPTMTASGFCITDFLIASLIIDVTMQYKILRGNIKKHFIVIAGIEENNELSNDEKYQYLKKIIEGIVTQHLSIINITNDLNEMCSGLLLIAVTASMGIMAFSSYYASVLPMLSTAAFLSYFEVSAVASTLFLMCYFGTHLSIATENIASTLYKMDFVGLDIRFQKSLMLIIMRSQKPCWLTIGGFSDLSIGVFAWIIRNTYSYLMILRKNTQVKENIH
ncbi:hypothetical protein FQA39_LY13307 [Lamprigera yunnana]|nr:hypothetical protein FQA39_LY13307 [Lamprigera yunnana]